LSNALKNEGEKPRWTAQDAYILIHKVDSLDIRHDSEIDWKTFPDQDWNIWSPHLLQRRWTTMKRSVKGHETMTHAEILDVLREKKASHLPTYSIHSPKKKYKSDDIIDDEEEEESAQAGPSSSKKK